MSDELKETSAIPSSDGEIGDQAPDAIDSRVLELVDGFFEQLKAGGNPDAEQLIRRHPECAEELRECIESIRLVTPTPAPASVSDSANEQSKRIGDFQILREVGRGGMGVVYEAEQVSLNRRVALKLLRHAIADPEAMERFQREAETVANLHHSNIVPIFAVGEENGQHYFAMQFIEGKSLADIANKSETPIETLDIADWGLQTAEALAYSHEHDVIHRDVKPSNLIRDTDGKVWLTDFGLAKRIDDLQLSMTGAILGTPRYMSPEQASSMRQPVDHRTDIYSLGATMYELATGQPLFDADSPHVALGQIMTDDPPSPRSIRQSLPLDMDTIISRCISKRADDRYNTAQELVSDLRAFIDGRAIASRRPSWKEQLSRWIQKNKKAIAVAAAAAAIAAVLVVCFASVAKHRQTSKMAKIRFDVEDSITSPLVAEILDEHGDEVVPSFTIPTQQKVEIPQGDYRLLLRGRGQLSETYNFSAYREPTRSQELVIRKEDHKLWEPKQIDGHWRLWDRPDGDDIVVFELDGVRVLDGTTTKEIWYADLQENATIREQLAVAGFEWSFSTDNSQFKSVVQAKLVSASENEPIDLDADGVDDLILAFNFFPVMVALSGADGRMIWSTANASPVENADAQKPMAGAVVGTPIVRDINGDAILDFVSTFAVKDHAAETMSTISAISGSDGEPIWSYEAAISQDAGGSNPSIMAQWFWDGPQDLSRNWHTSWGGSFISRKDNGNGTSSGEIVPFGLDIVTIKNRDELIFLGGKDCIRLDLATGREQNIVRLGFFAACPPQILPPLKPGGGPSILLSEQKARLDQKPQLQVKNCDLQTGTEHWSTTVEASWVHCVPDTDSPYGWPLVADLDADGVPEIVVPDGSTMDVSGFETTPAGSLQVLDSRTGERRWTDPDTAIQIDYQLNHLVAINDCDGDGVRDVASVSCSRPGGFQSNMNVFIDVFSGVSGKRLFMMRSPQINGFRGPLGRVPMLRSVSLIGDSLLIDVDRQSFEGKDSGSSLCFSLSQRKLQFVGDEMAHPALADLDNDGELEFVAWRPVRRHRPIQGGELIGFKRPGLKSDGTFADSWQYAGQALHPISDVDSDGVDDAFRLTSSSDYRDSRNINMVSGVSGEYVWSNEFGKGSNREIDVVPVGGDLDGDGAEDLLIGYPRGEGSRQSPFEARSGRTGETFWKFQFPGSGTWSEMKRLAASDLDGDGKIELLVAARSEQTSGLVDQAPKLGDKAPVQLYCLDATNGSLRWENEIFPQNRSSYWPFKHLRTGMFDVNQDKVPDVVTYCLRENGTIGLQAINGRDGTSIWKTKTIQGENEVTPNDISKYPWFENFDSNEDTIALLDSDRKNVRLIGIDAATGQPRWIWETEANGGSGRRKASEKEFGCTAPKMIRTKDGNRIGFWYWAKDESVRFVVLRDGASEAIVEQNIQLVKRQNESDVEWRDYVWSHRALPVDLNNDHIDELLFTTPKSLVARSVDTGKTLWNFDLPSVIHQLRTVDQKEDGTVEIVVAVGEHDKNLGVEQTQDATVEIVLEKGEDDKKLPVLLAFNEKGKQTWSVRVPNEDADNTVVLASSNKNILPRILQSNHGGHTDSAFSWCVPAKPSNEAMFTHTQVRSVHGNVSPDPRLIRDLPWGGPRSFIEEMVPALAISVALLGLPLYYVGWLSKGQWSLRTLLVAPVVAAIWLSVASLQLVVVGGMSPISPLVLNLMLSVYCLPTLISVYVAARLVWNRDWKRLRMLLALYLFVAFLMGTWMLWMTGILSDSEPIRINWTLVGVSRMLYYGVGATGFLLTLGFVGKKVFQFAASRFRRNAKPAVQ